MSRNWERSRHPAKSAKNSSLLFLVVLTASALLLATSVPASAQGEGQGSDAPTETGSLDGEVRDDVAGGSTTIEVNARNTGSTVLASNIGNSGGTTGGGGSEAPHPDDNCIDLAPRERIPGTENAYYSAYCLKWRDCGTERVDDVLSGQRAHLETTGQYRIYLDEIAGILLLDVSGVVTDAGITDITSVSGFLLSQGLDDAPSDVHLPVFNWCAERDSNGYDPATLWDVSFDWSLTFDDVYDIPGALIDLYGELESELVLYEPEIGLVPPAERGFTFVQWPTWMFLDNPPNDEHLYTTNSIDTLRIDLRAVLIGVDWHFGNELVASCTTEDMLQYEVDTHHPIDNLPTCHHIFTQIARNDLTVTINFKIEQRISGRLASLYPYPDNAWTDFLGAPTIIDLQSTLPDYEIHPIVSVNVPPDLTRQQIIDNARTAGTLPTLDD